MIVGYIYESVIHCVKCTIQRFPALSTHPALEFIDSDGYSVVPVTEEESIEYAEFCCDCLVRIGE